MGNVSCLRLSNLETSGERVYDDGAILDVFEKGYRYRDKVIRHAKVIVNKK